MKTLRAIYEWRRARPIAEQVVIAMKGGAEAHVWKLNDGEVGTIVKRANGGPFIGFTPETDDYKQVISRVKRVSGRLPTAKRGAKCAKPS